MSFGISNFDSLPYNVKLAFEDLEAYVNTFLLREHNPDGTHGSKDGEPSRFEEEGHWWRKGPWLFDDPTSATPHVAGIRPPNLSAGTYHDYAPQGIDSAVMLEMEPDGAVVLTGIKVADTAKKRRMAIRNRDSSNTITLKHANTGSLVPYRFDLPNSEDLVLGPKQNADMWYDPGRKAWTLFVTPHQSGGLATMGGVLPANLDIAEADLEVLGTTPMQIIAAGGAGTLIVPLLIAVELTITAGYGSSPTFRLNLNGSSTAITAAPNPSWTTIGTKWSTADMTAMQFSTVGGGFDPRNKAVMVSLSADPTGAGSGSAKVYTVYRTMTVTT